MHIQKDKANIRKIKLYRVFYQNKSHLKNTEFKAIMSQEFKTLKCIL